MVHPLTSAAPAAPSPPTPASGGFIVATSGTHNGNLGGLAGANSFCRTDLAANSWKNKPGILDTNKVYALLCDAGGCQIPAANTTYSFALSGDASMGGASFSTDGYGYGPHDSLQWNTNDHFGGTVTTTWSGPNGPGYWATAWGNENAGADPDYLCNDWSSNSISDTGSTGTANLSDSGRWGGWINTCNIARRLICYVNP